MKKPKKPVEKAVKEPRTYSLSHARHEPAHCLAPGLFRMLKKGETKREKLDVTYRWGKEDRNSVRFWGPEPLDFDDMRILQGIVAMSSKSSDGGGVINLGVKPTTTIGAGLRQSLDLKFDALEDGTIIAKGSLYQLARETGIITPNARSLDSMKAARIERSLDRIAAVTVLMTRFHDMKNGGVRKEKRGFHMLSRYATEAYGPPEYSEIIDYSEEEEGRLVSTVEMPVIGTRLYVALNPLLARAVVGDAQHVRIELSEVRDLKMGAARLAHQRLCAWIDAGKSGMVSLETLCGYVWPDHETADGNTKRQHRMKGKAIIEELRRIGWAITERPGPSFAIKRPTIEESIERGGATPDTSNP